MGRDKNLKFRILGCRDVEFYRGESKDPRVRLLLPLLLVAVGQTRLHDVFHGIIILSRIDKRLRFYYLIPRLIKLSVVL